MRASTSTTNMVIEVDLKIGPASPRPDDNIDAVPADYPSRAKAQFSMRAASAKAATGFVPLLSSTTPIRVRPGRRASNSRLYPAPRVDPVLIPKAPGYEPSSWLVFLQKYTWRCAVAATQCVRWPTMARKVASL